MAVLETAKGIVEKITGLGRPSRDDVAALTRSRKPHLFHFNDDGIIPNHPSLMLVVYRGAVRFPGKFDPAAVLEDLFARNGWSASWRNGIYDYVHYHSRTHEVLGVARGSAAVQFGGNRGRKLSLKAGDVAILPAGTGHQCLSHTADFLVVGAYPPHGAYDECTNSEDHKLAIVEIARVALPRKDPVYGKGGPLLSEWRRRPRTKPKSAAARPC